MTEAMSMHASTQIRGDAFVRGTLWGGHGTAIFDH